MKTLPKLDGFIQRPCKIAGEDCILIFPEEIGVDWTLENLNYRSAIVRTNDFEPISCGHKKFFNLGEKPGLYPNPLDYNDLNIESKEDGSLIIISKYKNTLICRTRGTVSAFEHEATGNELKELLAANPKITDNPWVNSEKVTLLFEHLSVAHQVIIKHSAPKLVLIGGVIHENYKMLTSDTLDSIAEEIGIERPKKFKFDSIAEIIENCKQLAGAEGYVISYNNFQNRVKAKGLWYLKMHRLKSAISSFDKVLDLFFELGKPDYQTFYSYIESNFDHELAEHAAPQMQLICNLYVEAQKILKEITEFVLTLKDLSRKDAALKITEMYGAQELTSYAFNIFNGKTLENKHSANLIYKLKK